MSDITFMSDISTVELRLLGVVGLLVTAVITTLLTMLLTSGAVALGRLVRRTRDHARGAVNGSAPRRAPQAGGRLRT